jgi:hypothetical protein
VLFKELENQPVEQWRGIGSIDRIHSVVLVQASVEAVAQSLNQQKDVALWKRDVYAEAVGINDGSLVILQLRGHAWSLIHSLARLARFDRKFDEQDAQALSDSLQTCAMYYQVSDSSDRLGYQFFQNGKLLEVLLFDENGNTFQSQLRSLTIEDIETEDRDRYDFTDSFLREKGIYIPDLNVMTYGDDSQPVVLSITAMTPWGKKILLEKSHFERVDYMVLRN